jgi:hypothetical protein
MNKRKLSSLVMVAAMTVFLSFGGELSFAANGDKAKPETAREKAEAAWQQKHGDSSATPGKPSSEYLAAKREMVRKQQEQRVTNEKRKAAADALKAERLKVYNAKQAAQKSTPQNFETK